jgi:hypothetical protein
VYFGEKDIRGNVQKKGEFKKKKEDKEKIEVIKSAQKRWTFKEIG